MKHFVIIITISCLLGCKNVPESLTTITGTQLSIDSSYTSVDSIAKFITPYHNRVEKILDSTIAYAPSLISKMDGKLNSTAGNLMADIIKNEVDPLFTKMTGNNLDFVLLNHGGIRAVISKGNISARTAYEIMPFENKVVVVALKGETLLKMTKYLSRSKRAHPVAGIQLILNKDNSVNTFTINGKPLDLNRTYFVATSDYLVNGGDNMHFFKEGVSKTETNYKIRNAMIDYFMKVDTINPTVDKRFYKLD